MAIGVADDGIDVDSAATTLTGIPRCANCDRGVEAVAGVTDAAATGAAAAATPRTARTPRGQAALSRAGDSRRLH